MLYKHHFEYLNVNIQVLFILVCRVVKVFLLIFVEDFFILLRLISFWLTQLNKKETLAIVTEFKRLYSLQYKIQ